MVHGRQDHVMSGSRELLWVAMVLMWSQVTEVTASPQPMKSVTFEMLPVSDVKFTQDVLWEKSTKSKVDCGRMCVGEACCSIFTFTPSTDGPGGSCRIHGKSQTPQGEQESAPGARSYNIITDFWIEKACITSSDCPEPMAACYSGQCLCDGGFFFDYCQNACVSSCSRVLGDTYVAYKNMVLFYQYKWTEAHSDPINACLPNCIADARCVGLSYRSLHDRCYYKNITAQDRPDLWISDTNVESYQRTCV